MKVNIGLNEKSIQRAIERLKTLKKLVSNGDLIKDFTEEVCLWIIEKANYHLDRSAIGSNVKRQIRNSWKYEITKNGATITNNATYERIVNGVSQQIPISVFIEFGVGIVGSYLPHMRATVENYQYNVINSNSQRSKLKSGQWVFKTKSDKDIDLKKGYFKKVGYKNGQVTVITKGSPAVMYAYNAIVDAKGELNNPNSKLVKKWNELLERYLEWYGYFNI